LQWLVIEWPAGDAQPCKYVLSTLAQDVTLHELIGATYQRWRIERDYQDLKQDFGLSHYEGRGWRGFHHHASLSTAAYGFIMAERLSAEKPAKAKKNFVERQMPAVPEDYVPRGRPARSTARSSLDHDIAP
jgi:SRSO17 transposase